MLNILIGLAILTVLASLVLGALNMRKTSEQARLRANLLMRIRVGAQFAAVILLAILMYLKTKTGA